MENVTSISASGFVKADFDTAHFTLVFSETSPKAKEAKSKLKEGVAKITAMIDSLKEKGLEIHKTNYVTGVSVTPNYIYDQASHRNVVDGQKASYRVSFSTPSLDLVNEAYDLLSELEVNELVVGSPSYSVTNESELKQKALEDAWTVAQKLFSNQCQVLGLKQSDYSVNEWEVDYSGNEYGKSRNMAYSMGPAAAAPEGAGSPIEINAGRAVVRVTLTVSYGKASSKEV